MRRRDGRCPASHDRRRAGDVWRDSEGRDAAGVAVSAPVLVHIERYTPDFDRDAVAEALRVGGYPGFVPALKKAPR